MAYLRKEVNMNTVLLDAPTNLGLKPGGVERLGTALQNAGLRERLRAGHAGKVEPLPYNPQRDPESGLLNPVELRDFALRQANTVGTLLENRQFPVVLGGDDSVLFGNLLALRRRGRFGLVFLDAHTDFYLPKDSPTGEASDCDLALVTGRGPAVIADLDGLRPLVRDEDVAALGYRDEEEQRRLGSPDIKETAIAALTIEEVRAKGVEAATREAMDRILAGGAVGFWIHLDTDVIDDRVNPAVDYRLPGGLSLTELSAILGALLASGQSAGMDITIFNPDLDKEGSAARNIVTSIADGFSVLLG